MIRGRGQGRHLGAAGGRGRADVPVAAGVSERPAGVRQQSRGHRRAAWRGWSGTSCIRPAGRRRFASGRRRAKTRSNSNAHSQGKIVMANARNFSRSSTASMPISTTASSGCLRCCGSSRSRPIPPLPATARRPPIIWPKDIATLGFAAEVGRPPGIPPSSPKPMAARMAAPAGGRMCCSTAITMCSRSIR